ncbi:uncharacterized protein LOC126668548 [Mercurialis annua]|uniref:uncharacterized protein LOC126668548 n=1 Tax=Mercurialis annua TaxID=3986 RepID=UPI0024AD7C50|nr:uncharacterized protein LOC126668548 [Mercurialis annua]
MYCCLQAFPEKWPLSSVYTASTVFISHIYCGSALQQTEELGREPTLAELHVRLHLTKADRTVFVDKRSKDKNDRFQAELAAATQSQAAGEGSSSTPEPIDENELFLSLEAIKKQRVYGIGSASASYIGQSSRLRPADHPSHSSRRSLVRRSSSALLERLRSDSSSGCVLWRRVSTSGSVLSLRD